MCYLPPVIIHGLASQLLTHAKMYEVGDKYQVSGLKALAKFWDDELFAEAAVHAFSTTAEEDHGLRRIVCETISEHMGLVKKEGVWAVVEGV